MRSRLDARLPAGHRTVRDCYCQCTVHCISIQYLILRTPLRKRVQSFAFLNVTQISIARHCKRIAARKQSAARKHQRKIRVVLESSAAPVHISDSLLMPTFWYSEWFPILRQITGTLCNAENELIIRKCENVFDCARSIRRLQKRKRGKGIPPKVGRIICEVLEMTRG